MKSAVYFNKVKLKKLEFSLEKDFEEEIKRNYKKLFGEKSIYIDIKNKIESISLGGAIPDGILFDLEDPEEIQFYLVEIELSKHDFYRHIFPQITKFFAFYKNPTSQRNLIESLYSFISENVEIKRRFEELISSPEIFKGIQDAVENNGKILLITDGEKPEIEEAQEIYTDTWDKLVRQEILNIYSHEDKEVIILQPDFLEKGLIIEQAEANMEAEKKISYTENYHLEGINPSIISVYSKLKEYLISLEKNIEINPQKYYISFRKKRNFAYFDIKKSKINIAIMVPFEEGKMIIKQHKMREFTEGIQKFYGRPSFEIKIENNEGLEEVFELLKRAYELQEED